MKKVKWSAGLWMFLWCFISCLPLEGLFAQNASNKFELQDGDRVVFLGNSLFEEDLRYNSLEYMLMLAFADKQVTFRNLGWSGDTVFGEARGYYTSPPTAYDLMLQQLADAKPTVVFLAYGANEATDGKEGIAKFSEGLNKLLDRIEELGARTVLLSPLPVLPSKLNLDLEERNQNLEAYAGEIARVAASRKQLFVDIFQPFQHLEASAQISDEGVHLNELGYFHLAQMVGRALQLPQQDWKVHIEVTDQKVDSSLPISNPSIQRETISFTIEDQGLPLLAPAAITEARRSRMMHIQGLKKGYYSLTVDGQPVASASAKEWAKGVDVNHGPGFTESKELRNLIFKKNELYFHQYRPLNRTYILGFRSYEQGRHKQGLEELGGIVTWLETQIDLKKTKRSSNYLLTPIQ
jgi:lysophospholipase L1-like esterase